MIDLKEKISICLVYVKYWYTRKPYRYNGKLTILAKFNINETLMLTYMEMQF